MGHGDRLNSENAYIRILSNEFDLYREFDSGILHTVGRYLAAPFWRRALGLVGGGGRHTQLPMDDELSRRIPLSAA